MNFWKKQKREIGIDIVDVNRFEEFTKEKSHHFLQKTFTKYELDYCFSHKDTAVHLAGIFAAKEAVSKALGVKEFPFIEIEIQHDVDGKPYASKAGKNLPVSISIAHTDNLATAIALI